MSKQTLPLDYRFSTRAFETFGRGRGSKCRSRTHGERVAILCPSTSKDLSLNMSRLKRVSSLVWFGTAPAFGDGPRNFEHRSSEEDNTLAGAHSPNFHTPSTGGRLSSRQI
ncbi:hypothetical protein TNCV_3828031 [Trichonephila clavipes]|nr:hypothetical protein TNCV_3828031 [Trichonephila clavipes]